MTMRELWEDLIKLKQNDEIFSDGENNAIELEDTMDFRRITLTPQAKTVVESLNKQLNNMFHSDGIWTPRRINSLMEIVKEFIDLAEALESSKKS